MFLEIEKSSRFVLDEISLECTRLEFYDRSGLLGLLKALETTQKYVLARGFQKLPWNTGSLKVLGLLQELRILTASEFILSSQKREDIQLILNDFLEGEFTLLVNLFLTSEYDPTNAIKMTALLDESLQALYKDILENPKLSDLKYLKALKEGLPEELLLKVIQKHLHIILDLDTSTVKEAFKNFSSWINEGVDSLLFPKHLFSQFLKDKEEETLDHLFKISTVESFKHWKFYLILVQTIASGNPQKTGPFIRKYLKGRLRYIASIPSEKALLHLLLTTRAATAITLNVEKNIDAYADWYKQNIGEMKFVFNAEEFRNIINLLKDCVDYEMEPDYIEIHSLIAISPPVLCGKLVQSYRAQCKAKLADIKNEMKSNEKPEENESILIEDSD